MHAAGERGNRTICMRKAMSYDRGIAWAIRQHVLLTGVVLLPIAMRRTPAEPRLAAFQSLSVITRR